MTPRPIRVVVADDQAIVRDGLVTVLGLLDDVEIVGEAADGAQAVELVAAARPDVVLMDLRMPVLDGAGATAALREAAPDTAVLVLTTFADDASIGAALRAGARGYLTKDASRAEVAAAVRAVAAGSTTLSAEVGARLLGAFGAGSPADPRSRADVGDRADEREPRAASRPDGDRLRRRFPALTPREGEVLALVSRGLDNAAIAHELVVSRATVKTHINALFAKLGVRDRAQAVALALRPED